MLRATAVCVFALLLCPSAWAQQPIPGSLEEFRLHLSQAEKCYARVDYRCVIDALAVPLLVRDTLPEGVEIEEYRRAYEILGVVYFSSGIPDSGDEAFTRLLRKDPNYHLTRTDVAPEMVRRVDRLRARQWGTTLAAGVQRHATWRAFWIAMLRALGSGPARALARSRAAGVRARARSLIPKIASPPWGPWDGPTFHVATILRVLIADDRNAWADAVGVEGFIGARYRPLYFHVGVRWTSHSSVLSDIVFSPPPDLDILAVLVGAGVRLDFERFNLRTGLELGFAFLDTDGLARSLNPHMAIPIWVGAELFDGFEFQLGASAAWTFGFISGGSLSSLAVSSSFVISLGVLYAL